MVTTGTIAEQYREQGFALAPDALAAREIEPLIGCIECGVERQAQSLLREGKLRSLCGGEPFDRRLARLHEQHEFGMRSWDDIVEEDALQAVARSRGLLDALAEILGPDLTFGGGFHLRPKLPGSELTAFPWHQDSQYYSAAFRQGARNGAETAAAHVVTAWIPLVDVDEANGCLWVIPGSHRWGLLAGERGDDYNIRTLEDVERRGHPQPVPMRRGDVLFFSNLIFHASKVNATRGVRWSMDLRYYATPGWERLDHEQRTAMEFYIAQRRASNRPPMAVRGRDAV
jgi:hypothetical protein